MCCGISEQKTKKNYAILHNALKKNKKNRFDIDIQVIIMS